MVWQSKRFGNMLQLLKKYNLFYSSPLCASHAATKSNGERPHVHVLPVSGGHAVRRAALFLQVQRLFNRVHLGLVLVSTLAATRVLASETLAGLGVGLAAVELGIGVELPAREGVSVWSAANHGDCNAVR